MTKMAIPTTHAHTHAHTPTTTTTTTTTPFSTNYDNTPIDSKNKTEGYNGCT
jgi:hypothetical protein